MNKAYYTDEIAAHEAGHSLALAVAGLAGEFTSCTIVPQDGVYGKTDRSGESLLLLSSDIAKYAQQLANPAGLALAKQAFREFLGNVPEICLPHVCFFFGGGSLDRFFDRECTARNAIDIRAIKDMVLPAMAVGVSDDDLSKIQSKVDEFLGKAFEKEEALFKKIYDRLVAERTILRGDAGDLLVEMQNSAERLKADYQELLVWFKGWYEPKIIAAWG